MASALLLNPIIKNNYSYKINTLMKIQTRISKSNRKVYQTSIK